MTGHIETIDEEDARLTAESDAREARIAARIQQLEDEGLGDGVVGALGVLISPNYTHEVSRDSVRSYVLRLVAERDIKRLDHADVGAALTEREGTLVDAARRVAQWLVLLERSNPVGAMSLQADDLRRLVTFATERGF